MVKLREVLATYQGDGSSAAKSPRHVPPGNGEATHVMSGGLFQITPKPTPTVMAPKPRSGSKQAQIRECVSSLIRTLGGWANREDILNTLKEKGIMGHEAKPMQSLASYLSVGKSEGWLDSDGKGNWKLGKEIDPTS
jgi:hypothetical protein